jgi:hypothetical protein
VSFLTDIAVVTIGSEDEAVAFVNARLAENDPRPQQLGRTRLEEAGAGGSKVCSVYVYAACFNWLDLDRFEEAVRSAPWRLPRSVVVCVDGESGPTFVFSPARAGRWEPGGRDLPRSVPVRLAGQQPGRATRAQRRGGKIGG